VGSQVLPANLLWHGLLSPWVHRSWQKPAPAWASHRVTASFGHPPTPARGPPQAAGGDLLHRGPPWAAGELPASPWSSPRAAGESLLWCLEHLLPLLFLTFVSAGLFLSHSLNPLSSDCRCCCAADFFPLLKYVITEALPPSLMGCALASSGYVLRPAGTGSIGHRGSF